MVFLGSLYIYVCTTEVLLTESDKKCTSELVKQKIDLTITKTTDGVVKAYSCDARVSIDSYFRCNSD